MSFSCLKCKSNNLEEREIVSLNCKHTFCWSCLGSHVNSKIGAEIKCPLSICNININDDIIRGALPDFKVEEYDRLLLESLAKTEKNNFKCLFPECGNIAFFDSKEVMFECKSCKLLNCVMCNATHPSLSCENYQEKIKSAVNNQSNRQELKAMKEEEFAKAQKELINFNRDKLLKTCELMKSLNFVPNNEVFSCKTCLTNVSKGAGIKLRTCFHMFCKNCIRDTVVNSPALPIMCPEDNCKAKLEDREIRGILNDEEYNKYYEKSITQAHFQINKVYHCKKPGCIYCGILADSTIKEFICPMCKLRNCVPCAGIHMSNETCSQYQQKKPVDSETTQFIEKEIKEGKYMKCTQCKAIIKKIKGCNWIKCPSCNLELCWILQIPRWGPKGRGDTSGGCKCGVDGKRCDIRCGPPGCIPEGPP